MENARLLSNQLAHFYPKKLSVTLYVQIAWSQSKSCHNMVTCVVSPQTELGLDANKYPLCVSVGCQTALSRVGSHALLCLLCQSTQRKNCGYLSWCTASLKCRRPGGRHRQEDLLPVRKGYNTSQERKGGTGEHTQLNQN